MPGGVLTRGLTECGLTGFWGKLPSHGDFVGRGLPETFRRRWDGWATRYLAGREGWPEGGLRLRIGADGRAAAGLVLPSADAVGRRFPLGLFLIAEALPSPEELEPWCEAALASAACQTDPDALLQVLEQLPVPAGAEVQGAPSLLLWRRGLTALPADPAAPEAALAAIFRDSG